MTMVWRMTSEEARMIKMGEVLAVSRSARALKAQVHPSPPCNRGALLARRGPNQDYENSEKDDDYGAWWFSVIEGILTFVPYHER